MKKAHYSAIFFLVLTAMGCQSQTEYVKVNPSQVDRKELEFAQKLSHNLLLAQKNGGYYRLSKKEATTQMLEGLHKSVQKQSYGTIKSVFGDYQGLNFESLMKSTGTDTYQIYRFKGNFVNSPEVEVRAVLDANGKLAGFFVKPWREKL